MSNNHFDVIVLGVGSMGAATCYHLAARGVKVLGLEQFAIPHEQGSHTGQSRIIRKAYFEHPDYVPLMEKAYLNWSELESIVGEKIFFKTGLLYVGPHSHPIITGVRKASQLYNIKLEEPVTQELNQRFPQFHRDNNSTVLFEEDAGFLLPTVAITSYVNEATRRGAVIHTKEKTISWEKNGSHIEVATDKGIYKSDKLVITAGAWVGKIIPSLNVPINVTRQVMVWVNPDKPGNYFPEHFPCWMIANNEKGVYYGFPYLDTDRFGEPAGLKFALHYPAVKTNPDEVNRNVSQMEIHDIIAGLSPYLPVAKSEVVTAKTCLYANSPDEDFIIDLLPGYDDTVSFACGFSGHGFKFASVIGEILSDLAMEGRTSLPIDFLRLKRFG